MVITCNFSFQHGVLSSTVNFPSPFCHILIMTSPRLPLNSGAHRGQIIRKCFWFIIAPYFYQKKLLSLTLYPAPAEQHQSHPIKWRLKARERDFGVIVVSQFLHLKILSDARLPEGWNCKNWRLKFSLCDRWLQISNHSQAKRVYPWTLCPSSLNLTKSWGTPSIKTVK